MTTVPSTGCNPFGRIKQRVPANFLSLTTTSPQYPESSAVSELKRV